MPSGEASARGRREIVLYFGLLMTTLGLADPLGVVHLPILFTLKDKLGLRPPSVAVFEAIIMLPVYLGFAFGHLRDSWRPRGWGDRGYFVLAAPVAACSYLWLAASSVGYAGMLVAVLLIMAASRG